MAQNYMCYAGAVSDLYSAADLVRHAAGHCFAADDKKMFAEMHRLAKEIDDRIGDLMTKAASTWPN